MNPCNTVTSYNMKAKMQHSLIVTSYNMRLEKYNHNAEVGALATAHTLLAIIE